MCKLNRPFVLFAASSNATPEPINFSTTRPNSACRPVTLHISPDALSLSRGLSRRNHRPWSHEFAIRSQQLTGTRLSSLDKYAPRRSPFPLEGNARSARNKRNSPKEQPRLTIETFVPTLSPCVRCASHSHLSFCTLRPCHLPMSNPPPPCHRQACPWTPRQAECRLIIDI